MDRLDPSALEGGVVRWLLDLEWAGRTIRIADAELDVLTDDGDVLHYHGTMLSPPTIEERLDFLADSSASPATASLDVLMPGDIDVPALVAAGHDLGSARGTVSRWIVGTTWESRRVLVSGVVSDPEHGGAREPVSLSLVASPWTDSATIPGDGLVLTGANLEDDWVLTLPADMLGRPYPIVVGTPGVVSPAVLAGGQVAGSQALPAWLGNVADGTAGQYDIMWIVAGHHVTAERVYLRSADESDYRRYGVINGRDRRGHPVAYVPWFGPTQTASPDPSIYPYDFDAAHTGSYAYGPAADTDGGDVYGAGSNSAHAALQSGAASVFVCWDDPIASGGGVGGVRGGTLRGAGDVLEWLLSQSGVPVDRGRFAAARALLDPFKLDFVIDGQTTPWEFMRANLLPILPVSLVAGPSGIAPVVWRYRATAADAVMRLDTGIDPRIERASTVSYDRDQVYNAFEVRYGLDVASRAYTGSHRLDATDAGGATPSLYCALSQRRYRRPDGSPLVRSKVIETLAVYDSATAQMVAAWMAAAYCFARRRVQYLVPEGTYGTIERGQVVTITDADVALSGQVALVEGVAVDGSPLLRVSLLLIESPTRDARA